MHLGWGALVFLAIVSPWYVAMSLHHPETSGASCRTKPGTLSPPTST
jgi:4-amino-4-deoxy-L-arabinose transferase-like glycosyltransferase